MPATTSPVNLTWFTTYLNPPVRIPLDGPDFSNVTINGVYMIYQLGNPGRVIRVGQGVVRDRLAAHRLDAAIGAHRRNGTLYVTYAAVSAGFKDGVERYLADLYSPLVGDAFPNAVAVPVSLPWAA
jgi:hypothetical protein